MKQKIVPRGIRNNNPLNIRIGNVWLGEVYSPTDPEFEQFQSLKYGLRAGFVLLRRYIKHYKRNTVQSIISAWAPAKENDTLSYIDRVCQIAKLTPDEILDYDNKPKMCCLVDAMVLVECGQHVDFNTIIQAYDIA